MLYLKNEAELRARNSAKLRYPGLRSLFLAFILNSAVTPADLAGFL